MIPTGSRKIVVNVDSKDGLKAALHNPTKNELQTFFHAVQQKHGFDDEFSSEPTVLRGATDGNNHVWGSANHWTHGALTSEATKHNQNNWSDYRSVNVTTDGRITDRSEPHNPTLYEVPGIGSKLQPAKTTTTKPYLQWGERTDNAIGFDGTGSRKIVVNVDHYVRHAAFTKEAFQKATPTENPNLRLLTKKKAHALAEKHGFTPTELDRGYLSASGIVADHTVKPVGDGRYFATRVVSNAIGFDGKHWPGRGEAEEDEDEYRTPAKLFK